MSKFDSCLVSLNLRDSVPVDALRATAAEYGAQGMEPGAAMLRAVDDQLQLAQMEEANIVKTVRGAWEAQGGAPKPEPKRLDHGELNIPGRLNNIDRELDKYKAEQEKTAKAEAKTQAQQKREDKARARELMEQHGAAMLDKYGPKFDRKELAKEFDSMVKWEPAKFIRLAEKFQQEQAAAEAAQPAEPKPAPAETAPAPIQAEPDALTMTPKQYHEAKLEYMARTNDVPMAEVREFYDTEAGAKNHEQEWVDAVREAAKQGTELARQTLDKLEEVRPGAVAGIQHDYPETKLPEGYQTPQARKAEAEKKHAIKADRAAAKAERAEAKPKAPALQARDKKIARKDVESTAQGMLATAKQHKAAAHKRVKELRQQIKDNPLGNSHLRLELIKAESRWKEYQQMERDANRKIDEDAERLGLTLRGSEKDGDLRASMGRTIEVDGQRRPITDSRGRLVAQDFAGQLAFWKFYGNGPTDAQGRPLVLYHGTNADVSEMRSKGEQFPDLPWTRGIYFTDNAEYAEAYADGAGANVMPVYVAMQNPKIVTDGFFSSASISQEKMDALRAEGFDGIINEADSEYVVFDGKQVKSAVGNAGTFDANNPDLRAKAQWASEAFRKWFGKSVVTNADGTPRILYHGTNKDIAAFKGSTIWLAGDAGLANQFVAGGRQNMGAKPKKGSSVYPVYASIKKPVDLRGMALGETATASDLLARAGIAASDALLEGMARTNLESGHVGVSPSVGDSVAYLVNQYKRGQRLSDFLNDPALHAVLADHGFDGIRQNEQYTEGRGKATASLVSDTFAVFRPEQIKSATGNSGAFDPNNADIRAAEDSTTSGIDSQIAQAIRDGITADALLALIESESSSADNRALAKALRAQQLKTTLEFGAAQGNYASGNAEQANASYRASTDTAYLHRDGGAEASILHELVHAATLRALGRGGRAALQIRALHKHVASMPEFSGYYGITDPEEFIAEAMTSPAFRAQLAATPAPDDAKKTLWQKFVGAVRMVLGLPAAQESMLDRVMSLAPDLMAENQARGPVSNREPSSVLDAMRASIKQNLSVENIAKALDVNRWLDRGLKLGPKTKIYRGVSERTGKNTSNFGRGLYTTTDKSEAAQYGSVLEMTRTDLPQNPLRFSDEGKFREWESFVAREVFGYRRASEFEVAHGGAEQWARELDPKIDGFQIGVGHGAFFVKFPDAAMEGDIRASMPNNLAQSIANGLSAASLQELPTMAANRLKDFRNVGLQFLGRRQLVDLYADQFKAAGKESTLARYSALMQQMDADKNEAGAEADGIADRWGKLADADKLADLMHDSTLAQIDPTKDHIAGDDKAAHAALQRRLKALSPEGQALYKEARDAYHKHWMKVRAEIRNRIERAMPESPRRAKLLEKMDATFYEKVKGVYFPLARFGEYVVTVSDKDGARMSVNFAETTNEAEALRRDLLKKFPAAGGHVVSKITKKKEFNPGRDAVSRGFMQELFGVLDQYEDSAELQDDINQLYLSSMPDLSWAKHGIHRKGTPGYSQDARRAFAQNMFHGARYLAKLRYGDRLADFLDEMQDHVDAQAAVADYDSVRAQQVVDEMNKRHESYMNPKGNSLSSTLTSIGFIFYLGLSPASAVVNLTQTPLVTLPMLAAKHGFAKASAALLTAARQAAGSKNDISKVLQGDELRAYQQAVDAGVIDVSMAHDLAGIAAGDDTKAHAKLRPVMKWASFMFHHGEKFNRQASLLAAYRLAREAGGNHETAYKAAVEDVYASHFDYSAGNRPRVMQGNVARVVLLFKQYSQNMIYTLTRNAALAAKGDKVARRTLGGLLISHAMAAGVLGLPVVGTLLSAATMLGSDEDEPWDAKVALRNYIADLIGQKPAEVMMHGMSRLGPFDISGRVGLDKLLLPDIQEGLEGARAAESWMTAALGPVAGIGISVVKALDKWGDGDYQRALEDIMPVSIRNPIKALRLHSEGVKDKSGIPILDDTSAVEEIGQLLGFSPSRSREAMEGKGAVYRAERRLLDRRQALVEQWANARMAGDDEGAAEVREAIKRFNAKNKDRRITMPNLVSSLRSRNKRIAESEQGVYLPKKHAAIRDLGRFANANE